jgi:hypothetical protein
LIDKNWFQKLAKSMGKITKINSVFIRQVLNIIIFFEETPLYLNFMENSFHFMTQKYQNFRYRVKRTGPKSPTLPYQTFYHFF